MLCASKAVLYLLYLFQKVNYFTSILIWICIYLTIDVILMPDKLFAYLLIEVQCTCLFQSLIDFGQTVQTEVIVIIQCLEHLLFPVSSMFSFKTNKLTPEI